MIPPGGEGEIEVTLKPKGNHQLITKRLTVESNDPEQPKFTLTMKGELLIDMVAQPSAISLRDLKVGTSGTATFGLQQGKDSSAAVLSVSILDEDNFDIREIDTAEGDLATYEVTFHGRDSVGNTSTRIIVKTSGVNTPELVLPVHAGAAMNLRYPRKLRFMLKNGELQPRMLRITARDGTAPTIEKIVDPDGLLEFEILEPKGAVANIELKINEDALMKLTQPERLQTRKLIIHTSDRDEPKIELEYQATGAPPARSVRGMPAKKN